MQKYLIFFIAALGIFLVPHFSFAATYFSQTNDNSSSTGITSSYDFFLPTSTQINTVSGISSLWIGYVMPSSTFNCSYNASGQYWYGNNHWSSSGVQGSWDFNNNINNTGGGGNNFYTASSGIMISLININGTMTKDGVGRLELDPSCQAGGTFNLLTSSVGVPYFEIGDSSTTVYNDLLSGGIPPIVPASLSFLFPTNSTTTAPFTDWIIQQGGLPLITSSTAINLWVLSGSSSTDLGYSVVRQFNPQIPTGLITLQYPGPLQFLVGQTSTDVFATAYLVDPSIQFTFQGRPTGTGNIYASSSIAFLLVNSSTFVQSGGGLSFLTPLVASSSQTTCSSGNIISDGFCIFAIGALTPQQGAQSYLADSVSAFSAAPPFSDVFQTYAAVQSAASSAPASQDLTYQLALGDGTYVSSATQAIPFLTSSTMSGAITPAGKSFLFQLEDAMFDLLTLGLIFFIPWHWWRKKHSAQKLA